MRLLVLDDEKFLREGIQTILKGTCDVLLAGTFVEAVALLDEGHDIDGAILDLDLNDPNHDGIEFLKLFKLRFPELPVLIESGFSDVKTVVQCIKLGAEDYITKPVDRSALLIKVERLFAISKKQRVLQRELQKSQDRSQIVGQHPSLLRAKRQVEQAGHLRILFFGETGVGKTPFALYSNRILSDQEGEPRPFEQINCAALNREHFQDQMFGHKKGAFTGAIADKKGLVELARGGDLFLDEIGEMTLETQALFLTFLDSMEYYRLGDDQKRKADVRILCATNRNLRQMIEAGTFRKDLFSRIAQMEIEIPSLKERSTDIQPLFEHFLCQQLGYVKPYEPAVLNLLVQHSWDEGNVRELRDLAEYLAIVSRDSDEIQVEHVRDRLAPVGAIAVPDASSEMSTDLIFLHGLDAVLAQYERRFLESSVRQEDRLESLARKLKVSRPTLYRKLKRYGISARA